MSAKARQDLVGVAEIVEMLGVSRQRVDQLVRAYEDFPKPVAELVAGRIWMKADIENWARRYDRLK